MTPSRPPAYFDRTRLLLGDYLRAFLAGRRAGPEVRKAGGREVLARLGDFVFRGKMIRGGLVCLGWEMTGRRLSGAAVRAGASLELIQSALLIHDDIMDRDEWRRGGPSFHRVYERVAEEEGRPEPDRYGEGMAICAGEIAIFLGFEVLSTLDLPGDRAAAALDLVAREFVLVGMGQMRDLEAESSARPRSEREILELYRFKTGRYSFALPLALGCLAAGGPGRLRSGLERCGELFGVIFQLKDDELGLFGERVQTGKPVGSDIRQGKKTLHHRVLMERARRAERTALAMVFGNPQAGPADFDLVRALADKYRVRESVGETIGRYRRRAEAAIAEVPAPERFKTVLRDLLSYNLSRKS